VAEALGLPVYMIDGRSSMGDELAKIYNRPGPAFVNVEINPDQKLYPVLKFGAALENQMPPLDPALLQSEMVVEPFGVGSQAPVVRQQSAQGW
jgi:acetolactate synthase-1/2/3 large subunit